MCNFTAEDWRHLITWGSLDASLHRAASFVKLRKSMERWRPPLDFWTTIDKGFNYYTYHPHKRTANSKDNEPQKPFGATFTTSRNLLQQAFRTQSHIGWNNFLKGRMSRDWLTYVRYNLANSPLQNRPRSKHISIKWHHFRDEIQKGNIKVTKIHTSLTISDILTKSLVTSTFIGLRKFLMGW
jgi:hypothetical protein